MPYRLVIVDDSPLYRLRLSQIFAASDKLQIVGLAGNGREAISMIQARRPDVLLLDLDIPELDGFSVLRWTMQHTPIPVIVCSGQSGSESIFEALEAGAIDFITKPQLRHAIRSDEFAMHLRVRVETAAESKSVHAAKRPAKRPVKGMVGTTPVTKSESDVFHAGIVAIVGSAGSPACVAHIIGLLPERLATPLVIAIHMPRGFTRSFAEHLARVSGRNVGEAHTGEIVCRKRVYVAPGGHHLEVRTGSAGEICFELAATGPDDYYTPSANRLLASIAETYGSTALGVVLTGMGDDGLTGAREIKAGAGKILIESRESAAIWGMPRVVSEAGLADAELNQEALANAISQYCVVNGK
ncbi:MAG: two-component system, chemotaxis family, protein-glutamate methylesterase/glutaminase [Blastocatellia bacterium]|jgi:two-component system chemotaxis response regulator CheB|nr:two-component system, chemotaxis family, protein-glutamate methylesterase/glutaminase [Blastocatellia bacterium]